MLAHHKFSKKKRIIFEETNSNYGPEYTNKYIRETLLKNKLNFKLYEPNKLYKIIAKKLNQNSIIGWFQGKMEFGHRALGNRSIIASPKNKSMQDKINNAIKFREGYRPFAPAVLDEYAEKYFI